MDVPTQRSNALARAAPAKTAAHERFKFSKSSTFKPNVNTEKISFVLRICIQKLIIVVLLVSRLVIWFHNPTFIIKALHNFALNSYRVRGGENRKWPLDFLRLTAVEDATRFTYTFFIVTTVAIVCLNSVYATTFLSFI